MIYKHIKFNLNAIHIERNLKPFYLLLSNASFDFLIKYADAFWAQYLKALWTCILGFFFQLKKLSVLFSFIRIF